MRLSDNPLQRFSHGFFSPFRAFGFIRQHARLYPYIIIPFLINLVVFSLAAYLGLWFFQEVVVQHIPQGDAWYWIFLRYLLWLVAILLTTILTFFSFAALGSLIASPFNDILSERTEEILAGQTRGEPFVFRVFLKDMRRILADESKKILLFILGMALIFLLNLLPGLGSLLYAVLSVCWTIFFLVVEYTGYVFGRKHMDFRTQRRFIFSRKSLFLGFGSGQLLLMAVPFLQFCSIPLGVVAATRLWHENTETAAANPAETGPALQPF
ncbi:MAG: hypothetical protein A2521_04895 [Deltaproteobacteria bacterium RIFOXYD12_FULL_57_12]|nr:MAG: hypothetical protein A2521_04895 [Deltaproteobacteria bacterium RIFOXYD12_FULL_57_12]